MNTPETNPTPIRINQPFLDQAPLPTPRKTSSFETLAYRFNAVLCSQNRLDRPRAMVIGLAEQTAIMMAVSDMEKLGLLRTAGPSSEPSTGFSFLGYRILFSDLPTCLIPVWDTQS